MLNRSALFKSAWRTARHLARIEGIILRQAFATVLCHAWDAHRAAAIQRTEMEAATAAMVAQLASARAARAGQTPHRLPRWQFANSAPRGGM
jgi:hypothetical protein